MAGVEEHYNNALQQNSTLRAQYEDYGTKWENLEKEHANISLSTAAKYTKQILRLQRENLQLSTSPQTRCQELMNKNPCPCKRRQISLRHWELELPLLNSKPTYYKWSAQIFLQNLKALKRRVQMTRELLLAFTSRSNPSGTGTAHPAVQTPRVYASVYVVPTNVDTMHAVSTVRVVILYL